MFKRFREWLANLDRRGPTPEFESELFSRAIDVNDTDLVFDLYKLMVASSEVLVNRRQGVNTFFLTANGALSTAIGLFIASGADPALKAMGVLVLTLTGAMLCFAWQSLIRSFGQLNTGKFAVINRLERELPVAVYAAEWKALGEGRDPSIYRTFTSREIWIPRLIGALHVVAALASAAVWLTSTF